MKKKQFFVGIIVIIFCISAINYYIVFNDTKRIIIATKTSLIVNNPSNWKQCHLVSCSRGNLGNQLWEYMSLYVVWQRFRKYGHIPYIEKSMLNNLKLLFPNLTIGTAAHQNITLLCGEEKGKWIIPKTRSLDKYENWFREKAPCRDIFLDQYSTRYDDILAYQVETLKKETKFHNRLVKRAQIKLRKLALHFNVPVANATFVGIHYRGNDYVNYLWMRYQINCKDLPDYRYYVKAMRYFKEKYQHIIFILITIDMVWLVENQHFIENEGNVVVNPYSQEERIHDLVLLSNCNHSIINYGTFGVTTAFFAGGTTYVYHLNISLDYRGATVALGFAKKLETWRAIF